MRPTRSRFMPIIAVFATVALLLLPTRAPALQEPSTTPAFQGTRVPTLVGRQLAEVGRLLEIARLRVGRVDSVFTQTARGTVLRQNPGAGTSAAPGSAVDVVFSRGQARTDDVGPPTGETFDGPVVDSVTVPDLSGSSRTGAMFTLVLGKLGVGATHSVADEQHAGEVFRQSPAAGARVPKGTEVEFWYGAERKVTVPDVRHSSLETAARVLQDSGLKVGRVDDPESTNRTGLVERQRPDAGDVVNAGTSIRLSLGLPPGVVVPALVGQPLQDAKTALANAGLVSGPLEQLPSDRPSGTVLTQNPQAGDSAARGSAVALGVAVLRPEVLVPDVVGRPLGEAEQMMVEAGLQVDRVDSVRRDQGAGLVSGQRPPGGAHAPRGAAASLTVAVAPPPPRPDADAAGDRQHRGRSRRRDSGARPDGDHGAARGELARFRARDRAGA